MTPCYYAQNRIAELAQEVEKLNGESDRFFTAADAIALKMDSLDACVMSRSFDQAEMVEALQEAVQGNKMLAFHRTRVMEYVFQMRLRLEEMRGINDAEEMLERKGLR